MSEKRRTRRHFIKTTTAAGTLAVLAPEEVFALFNGTNWIRANVNTLNASSPDIVAYKAGINAMKALPTSSPLNWNNWANIHGAPSGTGPLWNTCQHGHWWFLPWHRLYLLFFERIIRKLSNTSSFALPFWDYSASNTSGNTYPARALPLIFRSPTTNNPLFVSQRNPGINTGSQISSSSTSHATAFTFTNFTGPTGSSASFGSQQVASSNHSAQPHGQLEQTPHDAVHGAIGGLMGAFSTAARDPIFWLHHSNTDRLWNLWLAQGGGRINPGTSTWCNHIFQFFNENGTMINIRVRDVVNALAQYKTMYQGEPAIPTQHCPLILAPLATLDISKATLMTNEQPMVLGATATAMAMKLPGAPTRARAGQVIAAKDKTLVLRMEGVTVEGQPDIIWEVYVGLPAGTKADPNGPYFVGTLSTFGIEHAGAEGGTFGWPIDAAAAKALAGNPDTVGVTFVPRGLFDGEKERAPQPKGKVSFKRMRVIEE